MACGYRKIVQDDDDESAPDGFGLKHFHGVKLVVWIELRERLVGEQYLCLTGQCARQQYTGALTARQRCHGTIGELAYVAGVHCADDGLIIRR